MSSPTGSFDLSAYALPLAATVFFVALNGFFVAAEFALVKVRASRLDALAEEGRRGARTARHMLRHLARYLSACQLGITLASLILGWLAEPAVAELLLGLLGAAGGEVARDNPYVHGAALVIALTFITGVHMIFGEQAPKIWAIHRAEATAIVVAHPLRWFAAAFRPLIWVINELSNLLLRAVGISPDAFDEGSHDVAELKNIVVAAAQAGHISRRQSQLAQNVFGIMGLETRHILVPRIDVRCLSLQRSVEENIAVVREAGHSRFPLCETDLDSVVGIVHTRDLIRALSVRAEPMPELSKLARPAIFVPETQPLSRLIVAMQTTRNHVVVVVDEHGSAVGLAFLEDALEEIVGPLRDEFDEDEVEVQKAEDGSVRLAGGLALPKAIDILGLGDVEADSGAETIAGLVTARLGRLPQKGDSVSVGPYVASVEKVSRRRIIWLRFTPAGEPTNGRDA